MKKPVSLLSDSPRTWLIALSVIVLLAMLSPWNRVAVAVDLRTEVFELSRPAAPIAALVKPIFGDRGVASALGHTLVIRAAPETMAEIRSLIDRLDVPLRTLLVSVRHGRERAHQAAGASVWSSREGRTASRASSGGGFGAASVRCLVLG
jgi:hypothetical protein